MSPDNDGRNKRYQRTKQGKSGQGRDRLGFNDYQLLRIELTEAEKSELREFLASDEFPQDIVEYFLELGLSVKHSATGSPRTYLVSVTDSDPGSQNAGCTVTARGGSKQKAECSLYYKVVYLLGDEPWKAVQDRRGGSYDDVG